MLVEGGRYMRRTSVMLEFPDDVYDAIVEPMKKNKSFSKLVASLVEGYLNDGYIRAYADDNLEDMRRAAVDSFSASIDFMSESLSNMGLFTDELESTSLFGKTKFKDKAKQESENLSSEGIPQNSTSANTTNNGSSDEIKNISKRIDDMQSTIDTRLSQMLDLMQGMLKTGIPTNNNECNKTTENQSDFVNNSQTSNTPNVKMFVENVENSVDNSNPVETEPELDYDVDFSNASIDVDSQEADDFISSMLDGNSFSF